MTILSIIIIIALLNLILGWCKDCHELGGETITKIGRFEARLGIEKQDCRDFDLTISWEPKWYFTFSLSLWAIYTNFAWSRDPNSHVDCNHDGTECYYCGCKYKCGEKNDDGSERA